MNILYVKSALSAGNPQLTFAMNEDNPWMIAGKRVKLCDDHRYFRYTDVFLLKNQSIMWTL